MATESWRTSREHPVLGKLFLHNRNGVWWQSEIEISPGIVIRFDLQADRAPGGVESKELFERAAEFVTWAKQAEPQIREIVADRLLEGQYFCRTAELLASSQTRSSINRMELLSKMRLSLLEFYPSGSSDWELFTE